jgi:hypothetical protein
MTLAVAVALAAGLVGVLVAQTPGFDLHTGQWEMTVSGFELPPATLAKLPPDARAQAQAEMKKPHTSSSCISAADLKDLKLGRTGEDDDAQCTVTSKQVTRTVVDFTRQCTGDGKRTDVVHVEALTRETLRATIKSTTADGTMTLSMTGKWTAAVCKDDK